MSLHVSSRSATSLKCYATSWTFSEKMSNLWHNIQHWSLNTKTHENSYRKIMLQLSNVRYKIQENNLSMNAHEDSPKEWNLAMPHLW